MKKIGLLALLLVTANSTIAFGYDEKQACDKAIVDLIGKHLKIKDNFSYRTFEEDEPKGIVITAVCKPSPVDKNIELVAFAYDLFDKNHPEKEYVKDLLVAEVDKAKQRVVSSYQARFLEDAIVEVGESSLTLDTARYQLAQNVRGFGLRFQSVARPPSCGEGWWGDELTLFIHEGEKLRPVLGLPTYVQNSLQGCLSVQDPEAIWEDATITIGVEKSRHKGFADLLLTAQITPNANNEKNFEKLKPRVEHHLLRYDGVSYKADEKTKPWWVMGTINTISPAKPD